jgi:transposase
VKRLNAEQHQAATRMDLLIRVRAGVLTASAAAQTLGVSRKTWYEWENRGLAALLAALQDRPLGRPPQPHDPLLAQLQQRIAELEAEKTALASRLELKERLATALPPPSPAAGTGQASKKNAATPTAPPPRPPCSTCDSSTPKPGPASAASAGSTATPTAPSSGT